MQKQCPAGTVYIVDDDPDVLNSLRFLFEIEGFCVETFANGAALLAGGALPRAEDCLVIDYDLGQVNGLEVVRRLRELKMTAPVIMITIYEGLAKRAAAVGIHDILLKPHLEDSIVSRVEAAMDRARREPPPP